MTKNKRIRLWIVMRAASILGVPICPHQSYLSEEGTKGILLREEACQSGRVIDFPTSGEGVVTRIHSE